MNAPDLKDRVFRRLIRIDPPAHRVRHKSNYVAAVTQRMLRMFRRSE